MSERELRECPCCSGDSGVFQHNISGSESYFTGCVKCHLRTADYPTRADAIAAWNKRATGFNPSEEEILAHQYEPSFVVKLPLEKRRELLRRQSEDYLQVEPIGEQPPTETTTYCSGCAEMATLKEELRLLEGIEDCIMEQESKDFDQAMDDERTHLMAAYLQAWREGYRNGKADHLQELEVAVRGAMRKLPLGSGWVWKGDSVDIAAIGRLLEEPHGKD